MGFEWYDRLRLLPPYLYMTPAAAWRRGPASGEFILAKGKLFGAPMLVGKGSGKPALHFAADGSPFRGPSATYTMVDEVHVWPRPGDIPEYKSRMWP